jgi:hypothetical protein
MQWPSIEAVLCPKAAEEVAVAVAVVEVEVEVEVEVGAVSYTHLRAHETN